MFFRLRKILEEWENECFSSQKRDVFAKAFERISSRYRSESGNFLQTEEERKAYLFTRLPGTFSAVTQVLQDLQKRNPHFSPTSFLDVGAGPGTATLAAFGVFSEIVRYTLIEKDTSFMKIGQEFLGRFEEKILDSAFWKNCDLEQMSQLDPHDVVLFSYSVGELKLKEKGLSWDLLLKPFWEAAQKAFIIIEPGTPKGYQRLMKIRHTLLSQSDAYLWAPCPHSFTCPLENNDWCHFSVRVSRSSSHRWLKSADLGYEDEKFIYLIFGKEALSPFEARIIRHPMRKSGHTDVSICTPDGVKKRIYSKKEGEVYKVIKKLDWGDFY